MTSLRGERVKVLVERYGISRTAFYRCRKRFLREGKEGLRDRTSRPHKVTYRLIPSQVDHLVELRLSKGLGPLRLAPLVEVPATTIYRCLRKRGLGRLPWPLRPAVVRYEAKAPGELVHLDVLHPLALKGQRPAYQFTLVDDYTRMAYATISQRRTTDMALESVRLAQGYFGFPIRRILTDNDVTFAWTFRPRWRGSPGPGGMTRFTRTLKEWGIRHSLTRIGRPQTNGKVERFHRTVREEMYRPHPLFTSEVERQTALATYLTF